MKALMLIAVLLCLGNHAMALSLTSKNFTNGTVLPQIITCDGTGLSPELNWSNAPKNTKSFVITCEDPDAPMAGGFDHWVLFNIPSNVTELPQGISNFPKGVGQGQNSSKATGYYGPCPPTGRHRYIFTLYALDNELKLPDGATKSQVLTAIKGHVLGSTQLMGTYQKTTSQ